jgi:hypothetical protein
MTSRKDIWPIIESEMTPAERREFYKDKPKKDNPHYMKLHKQKMEALDKVIQSALKIEPWRHK